MSSNKLLFSTSEPFEVSELLIRAQTRVSPNFAYLPFHIKVCGFEKLDVVQNPIIENYSKLDRQRKIKDYKQFFSNNDTDDCPIGEFKLYRDL